MDNHASYRVRFTNGEWAGDVNSPDAPELSAASFKELVSLLGMASLDYPDSTHKAWRRNASHALVLVAFNEVPVMDLSLAGMGIVYTYRGEQYDLPAVKLGCHSFKNSDETLNLTELAAGLESGSRFKVGDLVESVGVPILDEDDDYRNCNIRVLVRLNNGFSATVISNLLTILFEAVERELTGNCQPATEPSPS